MMAACFAIASHGSLFEFTGSVDHAPIHVSTRFFSK
jgi:hypothetical protein